MSQSLIDELDELIEQDKLPQRVSNRLLFAMQRQTLKEIRDTSKRISLLEDQVAQLDGRVQSVEESQNNTPSLLWLLKNEPMATIRTLSSIVTAVVVIIYLLSNAPLSFVFRLFGLPGP